MAKGRVVTSTCCNVLRAIIDAVVEAGEEIVVSSIDFTAAFDSVSHKFLDEVLAEAGAAPKSRALFGAMYTAAEGRVRVGGATVYTSAEPFQSIAEYFKVTSCHRSVLSLRWRKWCSTHRLDGQRGRRGG
jgi:hypothetical protein